MATESKAPWHATLPTPKSQPAQMSVEELHKLVAHGAAGKDYIVVDARNKGDFENADGAFIHPGAINLPAQTIYQTMPRVYTLLKHVPKVIFHCNSCTPGGRGQRAAGWYQDHADEHHNSDTKAYVLTGGFKAWKAGYPNDLIPVVV